MHHSQNFKTISSRLLYLGRCLNHKDQHSLGNERCTPSLMKSPFGREQYMIYSWQTQFQADSSQSGICMIIQNVDGGCLRSADSETFGKSFEISEVCQFSLKKVVDIQKDSLLNTSISTPFSQTLPTVVENWQFVPLPKLLFPLHL